MLCVFIDGHECAVIGAYLDGWIKDVLHAGCGADYIRLTIPISDAVYTYRVLLIPYSSIFRTLTAIRLVCIMKICILSTDCDDERSCLAMMILH